MLRDKTSVYTSNIGFFKGSLANPRKEQWKTYTMELKVHIIYVYVCIYFFYLYRYIYIYTTRVF